MKLSCLGQIIAVAWMFSGMAQAAEVQVPLGHGTLAAAIADATDGDTLILGDGSYIGNGALVIDKSLVIRSISRGASSVIAADGLTIDAPNKEVVLQGLDFTIHVNVIAAKDVKVLENKFLSSHSLHVHDYKTTEGDGTLVVIGNHFSPGSGISTVYAFDAYIAGNIFENSSLHSKVPVWIVGNYVNSSGSSYAIYIETSGSAQVLANRVFASFGNIFAGSGIEVEANTVLIAGNIVQIDPNGNSYSGSHYRNGISVSSTTHGVVHNNIITTGGIVHNTLYIYSHRLYAKGISATGEVSGNLLVDMFGAIAGLSGGSINNLCFGNANNTCGSNAITTDPLLVDRIDYKLGTGSPAIDAGSTNVMLADLDRTRNDIGAHGGSWSIGQYDAQRDPSYFGPYVYPMFKANASFVNGQMKIRAIGVARLR